MAQMKHMKQYEYYDYDRNDSPHLIGGYNEEPYPIGMKNKRSKLCQSKKTPLIAPRPVKFPVGLEPSFSPISFDSDSDDSAGRSSPESSDSLGDDSEDIQLELNKIFSGISYTNYDNFESSSGAFPGTMGDLGSMLVRQDYCEGDIDSWPAPQLIPRLPVSKKVSMDNTLPVLGVSPAPGKVTRPPSRARNPFPIRGQIDNEASLAVEREKMMYNMNVGDGANGDDVLDFMPYNLRNRSYSEPLIWVPLRANMECK